MANMNMVPRAKLTDIDYTERDILEVELDVVPTQLVTEIGILKQDKQRLDILASNIPHILKYVADEEELENMRTMKIQFETRKNKLSDRLALEVANNTLSEEAREAKILDFIRNENIFVQFSKIENRDPRPIRTLRVVQNKGPKHDDVVANSANNTALMAKMIEFMGQNTEVIKKLMEQQNKK